MTEKIMTNNNDHQAIPQDLLSTHKETITVGTSSGSQTLVTTNYCQAGSLSEERSIIRRARMSSWKVQLFLSVR